MEADRGVFSRKDQATETIGFRSSMPAYPVIALLVKVSEFLFAGFMDCSCE